MHTQGLPRHSDGRKNDVEPNSIKIFISLQHDRGQLQDFEGMQEQKEVHRRRMIWKTGSFEMIKNEKESNATKKTISFFLKKSKTVVEMQPKQAI